MKTKILLFFFPLLFIFGCKNKKDSFSSDYEIISPKIQYMFFTYSSYSNFDIENIPQPNAALLIENKNEIDTAQELFLSEQNIAHLCGYNFEVLFWFDADSLYSRRSLNKECEVFAYQPIKSQELLNHYAKLLEINPSHYIYNIEIPVSLIPKDVKKEFIDDGLILFSFEDDSKRFPQLIFSYRNNMYIGKNSSDKKWEIAEQKNETKSKELITEIVDNIKTVSEVVSISEIYYNSYGRVGDSITHRGAVELIFKTKKDLSLAMDILNQTQAEIVRATIPETYTLQLIDTIDDIEKIKHKLQQYKFIRTVSKYNLME